MSGFLVFSLVGCGNFGGANPGEGGAGSLEEDDLLPLSSGKPVSAPVDFFYTIGNSLEIIAEQITEGTVKEKNIEISHTVITISGLKDKEVENRINDRIWQVYEKLKSPVLPPFRGIKTLIPETALIVNDYIDMYDSANFNNVLSVSMARHATYSIPNDEGEHLRDYSGQYINTEYVSTQETLNFDLNTGAEITLADVFADNVDYLALLNDAVSLELNKDSPQDEGYFIRWYGLKLAEPFKSLSPDQKFCLRPDGISLILDYDTPEFYIQDFSARTMDFGYRDFGDSVAIAKRFYTEGVSIFSSTEEPKKALLGSGYNSIPARKQEYEDGRVAVYNYVRISSEFPEMLLEKVMELAEPSRQKINELNGMVKEGENNGSGREKGYLEEQVSAAAMGRYATIMKHTNGVAGDHWFFSEKYRTYDLKTGEELMLSDIFTEGFDYIPLVRKGLEKKISDQGGLYKDGILMTPEETQVKLDEALSGILEFCPAPESLWISAGEADYFGSHREPFGISLSYEEIGYENLVIFARAPAQPDGAFVFLRQ
ncbi:hypothetical protein MASR2M70_05910 [Bacillota bacterium]